MIDTGWNDERIELMKRLWADGLSTAQIAGEIGGGLSRNAVIGKIHRMGLTGRSQSNMPRRPRKPRAYVSTSSRRMRLSARNGAQPTMVDETYIEPVQDIEIPVDQRKTLLQLNGHDCKWPCGDPSDAAFFFCGGEQDAGSSYCKEHHYVSVDHVRHRHVARPFRA